MDNVYDFPMENIGRNQDFLELMHNDNILSLHTQEASLDDVFIKAGAELTCAPSFKLFKMISTLQWRYRIIAAYAVVIAIYFVLIRLWGAQLPDWVVPALHLFRPGGSRLLFFLVA